MLQGQGRIEQGGTAGSKSTAWLQATPTLQPHFSPGFIQALLGAQTDSAGAQQVFSIKDRQREASAL